MLIVDVPGTLKAHLAAQLAAASAVSEAALDAAVLEAGTNDSTDGPIRSEAKPRVVSLEELPEEQQNEVKRRIAIRKRIAAGETLYASDGTGYIADHVTGRSLTLRLAIPKVRGKAARKALKRERHRARNRELLKQGEREQRG